jgi:hypothetical protein
LAQSGRSRNERLCNASGSVCDHPQRAGDRLLAQCGDEGDTRMAYDANSSGRATRIHARSLRDYTVKIATDRTRPVALWVKRALIETHQALQP